jgi:hypothetical protein
VELLFLQIQDHNKIRYSFLINREDIMWIKNTSGQKSASLTFVSVGFGVVTLWLLVSILSKIGHLEIREFDSGTAMGYLTPLLALYFGRRWTDGKYSLDMDPREVVEPQSTNNLTSSDTGIGEGTK